MSTNTETTSYAASFMKRLRAIRDDRGKMAALRRGLSDATQREAWPVIASLGADFGRIAPRMVSALYAAHPEEDSSAYSFGATCRRVATDNGREREIAESFESRFRRLLACDFDVDVAGQLKAWIRLAASRGVGVNYEQLFWDLDGWKNGADRIKLQWARDFWPARREAEESATTEEPAP